MFFGTSAIASAIALESLGPDKATQHEAPRNGTQRNTQRNTPRQATQQEAQLNRTQWNTQRNTQLYNVKTEVLHTTLEHTVRRSPKSVVLSCRGGTLGLPE